MKMWDLLKSLQKVFFYYNFAYLLPYKVFPSAFPVLYIVYFKFLNTAIVYIFTTKKTIKSSKKLICRDLLLF